MAFETEPGEDVVWREFANRVVLSGGGIPGTLIVTNQRIVHCSVLPCWPFKELDIDLGDVVSVARYNVFGIVPNGVVVKTSSRDSVRFQVCVPARIVELISSATQQCGHRSALSND